MTTTIEDKCRHELLLMIGNQPDEKGGYKKLGNCLDCNSTRVITDYYRFVSGDVYVLKQREVNALECRE